MELHAIHRQSFMLQRHDFILRCFRRNLQAFRQAFRLHNQRMIARCLKAIGHILKNGACRLQIHLICLTMHNLRRMHNVTAKSLTNRLMPQADAQNRELTGKLADNIQTNTRLLWITRTGEIII